MKKFKLSQGMKREMKVKGKVGLLVEALALVGFMAIVWAFLLFASNMGAL